MGRGRATRGVVENLCSSYSRGNVSDRGDISREKGVTT